MAKYLSIDEEGYVALDGLRVDNEEIGQELFKNLNKVDKDRFVTQWEDQEVLVEAFDEPLIARHVARNGSQFSFTAPYDFECKFSLDSLCLDEWDRFHGTTEDKVSFVFSRTAQMQFFDLVDEFDDESITVDGVKIEIPPFFINEPAMEKKEFWDDIYQTSTPGWELGAPSKPLVEVLPQLKLTKSRVLVLGCGTGQDAAYLAGQGHLVTAVDFSDEAIERAQKQYGDVANLEFIQQDVFAMNIKGSFNLILEHACYPAIPPERRNDLVQIWRKHLIPGGHLLGIFFIMSKRGGPPFGTSEWELRERLKKHFRFLYWTRWRNSVERRVGRELVIYAQKL